MFKEERHEPAFEWSMLGDVEGGRPNLGGSMPVRVYRLMQFTLRDLLIQEFDVAKADEILRKAGHKAGVEYYKNVTGPQPDLERLFASLQETLKDLKIGIFRVESSDPEADTFTVTIAEDLDCSGIPVCSEQICTYDEGFLGGVLNAHTGRNYEVKEVDCWGTGDRVCRFRIAPE